MKVALCVSQRGETYAESVVTIAASSASNVTVGCVTKLDSNGEWQVAAKSCLLTSYNPRPEPVPYQNRIYAEALGIKPGAVSCVLGIDPQVQKQRKSNIIAIAIAKTVQRDLLPDEDT